MDYLQDVRTLLFAFGSVISAIVLGCVGSLAANVAPSWLRRHRPWVVVGVGTVLAAAVFVYAIAIVPAVTPEASDASRPNGSPPTPAPTAVPPGSHAPQTVLPQDEVGFLEAPVVTHDNRSNKLEKFIGRGRFGAGNPSALAGRQIWAANRPGYLIGDNYFFAPGPCLIDNGGTYTCESLFLGEANERGTWDVYVFVADSNASNYLLQRTRAVSPSFEFPVPPGATLAAPALRVTR